MASGASARCFAVVKQFFYAFGQHLYRKHNHLGILGVKIGGQIDYDAVIFYFDILTDRFHWSLLIVLFRPHFTRFCLMAVG